jgi:hypothetical protein
MKALKYIAAVAVLASIATADIVYDGEQWGYEILSTTFTHSITAAGGSDAAFGALDWTVNLLYAGDDSVVGSTTVLGYDGTYYINTINPTADITEGSTVYLAVYDNAVVANANYVIYSAQLDLQDLDGNWAPAANDVTVDFSSSSWQAVPEPATIGLFGLGALSAWFIRRNKKA